MSLINCQVELKLKWSKYCVWAAVGADNTNANPNNFLANDLKDQCIGMNIKHKT